MSEKQIRVLNPTGRIIDIYLEQPDGSKEIWSWTWHHTLVAPAWAREHLEEAGLQIVGEVSP